MKRFSLAIVAVAALAVVPHAQSPAQAPARPPAGLDTAAIDRAIGKSGQVQGDVYKISFPRTDLSVSIGDVKLKAGFALGSWAAFKSVGVNGTAAHGDLVLTQDEINPVLSALQEHKFEITALHNHLINETPHVMYMHFWGTGDAASLAAGLKDALLRTKTPLAAVPAATAPGTDDPPAAVIQQAIGLTGAVSNGVLGLSKPRPETIQMMGVTMPPAMGMATAINFQSAGAGRVAATGDFVMIGDEVNKVARVLRQNGIEVTALHNHMIHGSPELYFMHFWAVGDAAKVATGLKAALAELKQ